jgi:tetratricopeptide (TPR) repeat protein
MIVEEQTPIQVPSADESADEGEIAVATIAAAIQEIRFYLGHAMLDQARAGLAKLEQLNADAATLSAVEDEVAAAVAGSLLSQPAEEVSVEVETAPEQENLETAPVSESTDTEVSALPSQAGHSQLGPWGSKVGFAEFAPPAVDSQPEPAMAEQVAEPAGSMQPQHGGALNEFVADLEGSLGDNFLREAAAAKVEPQTELSAAPQFHARPTEHEISHAAPAPVSAAPAAMAAAAPGGEPSSSTAPPMFTYQPRPLAAEAKAAIPESGFAAGVDVAGMFGELKQELEAGGTTDGEDFETHYNLGVAFREMGLLDEAIGEFQKVCQAVDRGHSFPQLMQTYTWLAQCFLDKGVPEAAIRWYERALQLPNLDGETCIALHYELAGSYEAAQNRPAALKHFLEVYGNNIDYREVAERIRALKS